MSMTIINQEQQQKIIDSLPDDSHEALILLAAVSESVLDALKMDPCTFCNIIQTIKAARDGGATGLEFTKGDKNAN